MKILHINTHSTGGAFNGAYRLHQALLKNGIESTMLVRDYSHNSKLDNVEQFNKRFKKETITNKISSRFGLDRTSSQKKRSFLSGMQNGDYEIISFPFSDFDITESKAYQNADIIQLHWIGDYLDYQSFFKKNQKPVVWTLRDSYPFQGIFHLENDLNRNDDGWKLLNDKVIELKKKYLQQISSPFRIVGISTHLTEKSASSSIFNKFHHSTIHNCIDTNEFRKINKTEARKLLNIPDDKIVFCFVADTIKRYNKGFAELKEAIEMMDSTGIEFLSVGSDFEVFSMNVNHRHLGKLNNDQLQIVYSASDAFIFPTKEEALGNVMLEAMACGTPVIGTPVGGLLDVIKDGFNGIFAKGTSAEDLKHAIERFIRIRHDFNSDLIRNYIISNFSPQRISDSYLQLFNDILSV